MINMKIVYPLPDMLELSDKVHTYKKEIEFEEGMTTGTVMDYLARESVSFEKLWSARECAALQQCLFAVNGVVLETEDKWNIELMDEAELLMFMLYAGG